jgi:Zn finger protein HypA/HybF involved in hydrogenase expression
MNCPKCRTELELDLVPADVRKRAASFAASALLVEAAKILHSEAALSLRSAKAISLHLARTAGKCRRCGGAIPEEEFAFCPRCASLTVTW